MNKILITLIYALLSISIAEAAPITTKVDGFTYTLNTNDLTASLTKGDVYAVGSKTIPGEITYQSQTYTVTSIGFEAFKGATQLSWLTISENITSIGEGAFSGCTNLSTVTLPESLTEIGSNCFYNCKLLATINIPDNITSIGAGAFEGCVAIPSFKFPNGVKISATVCYLDAKVSHRWKFRHTPKPLAHIHLEDVKWKISHYQKQLPQ